MFMRKFSLLIIVVSSLLALTSCFKAEPLNAECDIEMVTLHVDNPDKFFFQLTDSVLWVNITDSVISLTVREHADITRVIPEFNITEGAVITPSNNEPQDFSNGPIEYLVTSQNGKWKRRYKVDIVRQVPFVVPDTLCYDFEHFELESSESKYYVWFNTNPDGSLGNDWASGNGGFRISMGSAKPMDYPTTPCPDGFDGYCIKLTTRDTGAFGKMASKPIAAGNLFLGDFDLTSALKDAMKATRFGKPFPHKPLSFHGYYKYKAGAKCIDKNSKEIPGMVDHGSVYAVFYRNHDDNGKPVMLFGDDVLTSPNIVALAKVKDMHDSSEWVEFDIDFEYYKEVDMEVVRNRGYNFAIVFSSSVNGDIFTGAVGSELMVDKVRVVVADN